MFGYAIYFYLDYLILNLKFSNFIFKCEENHNNYDVYWYFKSLISKQIWTHISFEICN